MSAATDTKPTNLWRDAWKRLRRNKLAVTGLFIVLVLVFVAITGPYLTPYDFLSQNLDLRNAPPSLGHPFGTDDLGRDVISRVIYGARTALIVAVMVTLIAVIIGVVLGAVAGFYGGTFDKVMMWSTDMTMSVPQLLLVVVINASLKQPIATWMENMYLSTGNQLFRNTAHHRLYAGVRLDGADLMAALRKAGPRPSPVDPLTPLCHRRPRPWPDQPHHPDALRPAERDGAADRGRLGWPWHRDGAGKRVLLPRCGGQPANAKLGQHDL